MFSQVLLSCFLILGLGTPVEMKTSSIFQKDTVNLTAITWAHAVNTQELLTKVLKSDIQFIEADIVLGILDSEPYKGEMPVMGHPPINHSDISLAQFLEQIQRFNNQTINNKKGVKLDFKSIEVFEGSLDRLTSLWSSMDYPVWINADILAGPVNNTETTPVEPNAFFHGCKRLPSAVLSIGWTTQWGENYTDGHYTDSQILDMIETIKSNNITNTDHPITFPVRAGIAAQSLGNLEILVKAINETNNVTLTIWSSENDTVNIDLLRKLIFSFGVDKVYVDVPMDLSNQLDLGNAPGRASSLIHFGIITLMMLFSSILFSNCQF